MNRLKIFIFICVAIGCYSQEPNNEHQVASVVGGTENRIKNTSIRYEIDSLEWYKHNSRDVVGFMDEMEQEQGVVLEELVAYYTVDRSSIMSFPSIMILNREVKGEPPPLDQLERELGAISFSLSDFEPEMKLSEVISDFDFKRPVLIREKRLILMETTANMNSGQTLKVRQSLYFRDRNVVAIQISYIEGEQDRYLRTYERIVDSIEF